MKFTISIVLIFMSLLTNAQEQKKFEHWDDRYNNADKKEMAKTVKFLEKNKIAINEIINPRFGICKYTLDNLPYVEYYSNDTLIFLMPGGLLPLERTKLELDKNKKIIGKNNCFIEGVRKDGRISLRTPHNFAFLIEDKKLYAFVSYPNKSEKEITEIFLKIGKAETKQEKDSLFKEYNNCYSRKAELIVDLVNKVSINDTIVVDNERNSQLVDIYKIREKTYFEIKLNFDPYRGRKDFSFVVDNDLNIIRLEEFKLREN